MGIDGMDLIREIRHDLRQLRLRHRDPRRLDSHGQSRQGSSPDRRRRGDHPGIDHSRRWSSIPLTDKGLEAFLADWKKTGQKIA
jgi:transaldolase